MLTRKFCKSTISGSLAAFTIRVRPVHAVAASIVFSVAPTLGKDRTISLPRRLPALQSIEPPSSVMSAPKAFREEMCKSIGRAPSSHPPGAKSETLLSLARTAPIKITDERISRIILSGISKFVAERESTVTHPSSHVTLQPIYFKISIAASTSRNLGQLCITLVPELSIVAARIGRTLFFEPCTDTIPSRALPPFTINVSITRKHPPTFFNVGRTLFSQYPMLF